MNDTDVLRKENDMLMLRVDNLELKLSEVIRLVNNISNFYSTDASGYAGSVKELKEVEYPK